MSKHNEARTQPYNDVMEHKQRVEGYPNGTGGRMPLLIRLIGYLIFGGIFLMMIIAVFAAIFLD
ncbi:hypothetical protein [Halobacillus amylolyticus]|uniref:Amino acid transporter n=1 Tax=Halobacillus amylolyticus TaxID=2932259 RepID=A0ABY4HFE2_9BACI|nr:hypothetical protein [Halobacillus amylolyticus]UOR13023.1 hypothetical protein MUO15_05860 [Halobacillus amylolyticus]